MAKAIFTPKLDCVVRFEINRSECAALDALAGYGDDAFIKAFYETLGEAYMMKHEDGLREFLKTIREVVGPGLVKVQQAELVLKQREERTR